MNNYIDNDKCLLHSIKLSEVFTLALLNSLQNNKEPITFLDNNSKKALADFIQLSKMESSLFFNNVLTYDTDCHFESLSEIISQTINSQAGILSEIFISAPILYKKYQDIKFSRKKHKELSKEKVELTINYQDLEFEEEEEVFDVDNSEELKSIRDKMHETESKITAINKQLKKYQDIINAGSPEIQKNEQIQAINFILEDNILPNINKWLLKLNFKPIIINSKPLSLSRENINIPVNITKDSLIKTPNKLKTN